MALLHSRGLPAGILALGLWCLGVVEPCPAQDKPVTVQVQVVKRAKGTPAGATVKADAGTNASDVAVWLTPLDESAGAAAAKQIPQLIQRNKSFVPHLLVVQTGSAVQFPNEDPFFHNVFSLFDGKRFDLGLYESGTSRTVRFERSGVSFLFCNIHSEMSAIVVSVATPYFGVSDRSGRVTIASVPDGRYRLQAWYERSSPEDLKNLDRVIAISDFTRSVETIQVVDNAAFKLDHKNMYGQDYVPPATTSPSYH